MSQQQSDKHGPAIDDELKDERRQEPAGTRHQGQPTEDPIDDELDANAPRPMEDDGVAGEHA